VAVPKLQDATVPNLSNLVVQDDLTLGIPNLVVQNGDTPVVPELPATKSETVSLNPAVSQRAIFAIYVYHPEPASCLKTSPELPVLPDAPVEAVTEQSPLPDLSPESATAKEATPEPPAILATESANVPENYLPCAHYVSRAIVGAVIFVGFSFLTLIQVLSESDQPVLLKLPVLLAPLRSAGVPVRTEPILVGPFRPSLVPFNDCLGFPVGYGLAPLPPS
ncbi:hypothetical protein M9458_035648, partial [Cirrhinus mrigala]